jgi:hypothetical protein
MATLRPPPRATPWTAATARRSKADIDTGTISSLQESAAHGDFEAAAQSDTLNVTLRLHYQDDLHLRACRFLQTFSQCPLTPNHAE